jgi:predicted NBD/HSP70 family sugar kinase
MMPTARIFLDEKQIASNRTPRQINRNLVFNLIRTKQPISRADLARISGLQRSTISLIVEELLKENWVVEGWIGESARGRKPTLILLNGERCFLALDVHPEQTTLAVTDLLGEIHDEMKVVLPSDPQKVMNAILLAIRKTIATHKNCTIEGIGITLPGRFNHQLKRTVFAPNVQWPIAQIASRVEQATGHRVVVDNVANACALSEMWFGYSDLSKDLVLVNVSEGIGTGIYVNGRLVRGNVDAAGEFGHVQLDPNGPRCGCGSIGCWETLASNRAAMRYYSECSGRTASSFDSITQLAKEGDEPALCAINKMATWLGRGMHMIVSALAPSEIVFVGELTRLWPLVSPIIDSELRKFPLITIPRIRCAHRPDKARLRSAVALVMNEISL